MKSKKEIWRWILNYQNKYAVSNFGRIYSNKSKKILKLIHRPDGYISVSLWDHGKGKHFLVHVLVCEAFHGPKPGPEYEVRHFPDQTKSNNNANNLQWSTHLINEQDKEYVLNDKQVIEIKKCLLNGETYKQISKKFNVIRMTVSQIARGKTYKNIGPNISHLNFDSRPIMSDEKRKDIIQMIKRGCRVVDIVKKHKISRSQVYRIKNGEMSYCKKR